MVTKAKTKTVPKTEIKKESVYTKEQILKAKKYADRRDLLSVLLMDGREYAIHEVDTLLNAFMKGKVK